MPRDAGSDQPRVPGSWNVTFTDIAERAGLRSEIVYGGIDRKRFIIETNGSGVALIDYDNDGWLDALTLSGTRLKEGTREEVAYPPSAAPTNRLYRNRHDGTFEDVTDAAGLRRSGWASSVCAGDYDNDGWTDLFVTYYGRNVLYRNSGGRFEDVTIRAGLAERDVRWGSGCTFVDVDRDGRLDLFVANYLRFDLATATEPGSASNCLWKGILVNCGPKGLPTDTNLLYRNRGDGSFEDVSNVSGIANVKGRYPMTALAMDVDADGWPDIYVACDSTAAILYRNNRNGTFTDVAVESGIAYSENGNPQAGMGVAAGDFNRDGRLDVLKTHFADDIPSLYKNLGKGLFEDVAVSSGLAVENRYVEWGAGLTDLDNDGLQDLVYVTGNEPQWSGGDASLEPRCGVRRHRQRRRHRCAGHEHERTPFASAKRLPRRTRLDHDQARRDQVQSIRHRRDGRPHLARRHAGEGSPEPIQLLLARRPSRPFWTRRSSAGRRARHYMAERPDPNSEERGRQPGRDDQGRIIERRRGNPLPATIRPTPALT